MKGAVGIQRQAGDRQRASGPGLGLQTEPSGGKLPSRVAVRLEQALGELVPPYLLRRKHLPSGSAAETRAGGGEPRGQLPARASRDNGAGAKGLDTHAEAGGRSGAPRESASRSSGQGGGWGPAAESGGRGGWFPAGLRGAAAEGGTHLARWPS